MTTTTATITSPTLPALWATTKDLEVGDWVAKAIAGQPRKGPADFSEVTSIEQLHGRKALTLADGSTWEVMGATKIFIAKADAVPAPVTPSAQTKATVAKALAPAAPALLPGSPEAKARRHAKGVGTALLAAVVAAPAPRAAKASSTTRARKAGLLPGTPEAEARQARQQAKAVRDADYAAQVAAEQVVSPAKASRKGLPAYEAAMAKVAGPKAAKAPRGRKATGPQAAAPEAAAPEAAVASDQAARKGSDSGVPGYVVQRPAPTTDLLMRVGEGDGPKWLVRCNAHGTTQPAPSRQGAREVRSRQMLATWCPGHAAAAK